MGNIYTGNAGVIKLNSATLAEVTSYSLESSTASIDSTSMGDTARTFVKGLESFTGSADVIYDTAHQTDIPALAGGTDAVSIELFPAGTASGLRKITGDVLVTGYSMTGSLDGMITASITFQGSGDLNWSGTAT
tara:strand:+ start:1342 stop:1743 length:402 start_codon:yes stop_codon:yes gene_type:complete